MTENAAQLAQAASEDTRLDDGPDALRQDNRVPEPQAPEPALRLSEVFKRLAASVEDRITVARIRHALGDRGFSALLLFFAAVNLLPLPPGTTLVLGLPLIIVSAQMVFGAGQVWLPRFVLEKSVPAATFRHLSERFIPWLAWSERFIRPRYWPMSDRIDERVLGVVALVLGAIVTLPIPGGNWFPALSIALIALSLIERDGILLAISAAVTAFSIGLLVFIIEMFAMGAGMFTSMFW